MLRMEAFDGFTLFTPFAQDGEVLTYLIDNDYNVINAWNQEYMPASMPYLLPDSSIIYPYQVNHPTYPKSYILASRHVYAAV